MKYSLIIITSLLVINCKNLQHKNNCEEVGRAIQNLVSAYYRDSFSIAQQITPTLKRWERLSNYVCSTISLGSKFCVVEIGGQEGLLYVTSTNQFYFFVRKEKSILIKTARNELKEMQSFILNYIDRPTEYLKGIRKKSELVNVYDAPGIDILLLDIENEKQSSFFSFPYSDYLFGEIPIDIRNGSKRVESTALILTRYGFTVCGTATSNTQYGGPENLSVTSGKEAPGS